MKWLKYWTHSEHTLNTLWTYSGHTLNIPWWYAQYLTKSQKHHSLTDWLSNMVPRDASASKNKQGSAGGGRQRIWSTRLNCIWDDFSGIPHLTIVRSTLRAKYGQIRQIQHLAHIFGCAKYGRVGYPWKDHAKCSSPLLTLGQQDTPVKSSKFSNFLK